MDQQAMEEFTASAELHQDIGTTWQHKQTMPGSWITLPQIKDKDNV